MNIAYFSVTFVLLTKTSAQPPLANWTGTAICDWLLRLGAAQSKPGRDGWFAGLCNRGVLVDMGSYCGTWNLCRPTRCLRFSLNDSWWCPLLKCWLGHNCFFLQNVFLTSDQLCRLKSLPHQHWRSLVSRDCGSGCSSCLKLVMYHIW